MTWLFSMNEKLIGELGEVIAYVYTISRGSNSANARLRPTLNSLKRYEKGTAESPTDVTDYYKENGRLPFPWANPKTNSYKVVVGLIDGQTVEQVKKILV